MVKIVDNMGNILESGVSESYAVEKVKSMYKGLGIDRRLTYVSIVSTNSVKVLSMNEMDFIVEINNGRFFYNREFDKKQGAFVVTDEEMDFIRQNCTHYYIMND